MKKEDWLTIARWIGYAYIPIALFVIFVFLIVLWQKERVSDAARTFATSSEAMRDR